MDWTYQGVVRRVSVLVMPALVAGACETGPVTEPGTTLVTVSPTAVQLGQLEETQLDIAVTRDDGTPLPDTVATLISSRPYVVGVGPGGVVRSVGPLGTATVTVATPDHAVDVAVTVVRRLGSASIFPTTATSILGDTVAFRARVLDVVGNPVDDADVTFSLGDTRVATLGQTDVIARSVGVRPGTTTVRAAVVGLAPGPVAMLTVTPDTAIAQRIPLSGCPGEAVVVGTEAFVVQRRAGGVARIDLTTGIVTGSVTVAPVEEFPVGIVATPDGATLFVAVVDRGEIVELDRATLTERRRIPLPGQPVFLALASDGATIYATAERYSGYLWLEAALYTVDLASGAVVDSTLLPRGITRVRATPGGDTLFVATSEGVFERPPPPTPGFWFSGSAFDVAPDGDRIWVADAPLKVFPRGSNRPDYPLAGSGFWLGWSLVVDAPNDLVLLAGLASGFSWPFGRSQCEVGWPWTWAANVHAVSRSPYQLVRTIRTGGQPTAIVPAPAAGLLVVTNDDGWVDLIRWP